MLRASPHKALSLCAHLRIAISYLFSCVQTTNARMAVANSTDYVRMGGSGLDYPLPHETFAMQVRGPCSAAQF